MMGDQPYESQLGLESAMPGGPKLSVGEIVDTIDACRLMLSDKLGGETDPIERMSLRAKELALTELSLWLMTRIVEDKGIL